MASPEETERARKVAVDETAAATADGDAVTDAQVIEETPEEFAAAELVESDIAELEKKAAERDEYLALAQRTQADFENYRKRMARDVGVARERGVGTLAKEILPALDNLARAVEAAGDDGSEFANGIRLVQSELTAGLGRAGITGFDPKGEVFDPEQHEAIAQTPIEGAESGTVVEVYQSGYRLNDTVLRPAKVVVAA
jgi:molecular chaperone GrpE